VIRCAAYLAALLREERAQGCRGTVVRVAVQQDRQGEALDDLIVDAEEAGEASRLSLQVKSAFAISAADADFKRIPDELPYAYAEEVGDADFEAYSERQR